jgi:hypothetical protein
LFHTTNCVIARETNLYAPKFLENTPNLKIWARAHHLNETNKDWITRAFSSGEKFWKHPYFWICSVKGGYTFNSGLFILLTTRRANVVKHDTTAKTIVWSCFQRYHTAANF